VHAASRGARRAEAITWALPGQRREDRRSDTANDGFAATKLGMPTSNSGEFQFAAYESGLGGSVRGGNRRQPFDLRERPVRRDSMFGAVVDENRIQ